MAESHIRSRIRHAKGCWDERVHILVEQKGNGTCSHGHSPFMLRLGYQDCGKDNCYSMTEVPMKSLSALTWKSIGVDAEEKLKDLNRCFSGSYLDA